MVLGLNLMYVLVVVELLDKYSHGVEIWYGDAAIELKSLSSRMNYF